MIDFRASIEAIVTKNGYMPKGTTHIHLYNALAYKVVYGRAQYYHPVERVWMVSGIGNYRRVLVEIPTYLLLDYYIEEVESGELRS